jgi:hypothetical protein
MPYALPVGFAYPTYDSETELSLGIITTAMESGTSRVRRRFVGFREGGTLTWVLTTAQRNAFLNLLLTYGADWFSVQYAPLHTLTADAAIVEPVWARPVGNMRARAMEWDAWEVSLPVEFMR